MKKMLFCFSLSFIILFCFIYLFFIQIVHKQKQKETKQNPPANFFSFFNHQAAFDGQFLLSKLSIE